VDASFDAPGFAEVEVHAVCDGEVGVGSAAEDDFVANTGISEMCDVCEEKGGGTDSFVIQTIGWSFSFILRMLYPKLCQSTTTFCPLSSDTIFATTSVGIAGGFCSSRNWVVGEMV